MPILSWDERFEVGITEMDRQHKKLIGMLNSAYWAITEEQEQEMVRELLGAMREYAMEHFLTEERLMQQHDYPDQDEHKKAHSQFMLKVMLSEEQCRDKDENIDPIGLFRFLSKWLTDHILSTDKELAVFLQSRTQPDATGFKLDLNGK